MAVTYRDHADGQVDTVNVTTTVSRPAGTQTGDLLVAIISRSGSNANIASVPSGWNVIIARDELASFDSTLIVAWYIATGSDPSTWDFTWGTTAKSIWVVLAVSGHDTARPIDVAYASYSDGPLPTLAPSVTARRSGMAIMALETALNVTVTPSGGLTAIVDRQTSNGAMAAGYKSATAGAVGQESFGGTSSVDSIACTVLVNEPYTPVAVGPSAFSDAVLALGPAGYWRLADEAGGTAPDEVGSNDGTYAGYNSIPFDHPAFTGLPAMAGFARISRTQFGPDATIQGVRSRIALPSVDWWPSTPNVWSIMAVVQLDFVGGRQTIFGASGTSGKPQVEIGTTGNVQAIIEGTFLFNSPANTIVEGTPYLLVVTRNGSGSGNWKLYVNAVDITLSSLSAANNTSGAFVGLIGARTTTSQASGGRISDVALFTSALSQADVSALYALLGSTPPAGEPRFDSWWN